MMRSTSKLQPCVCCTRATRFERDIHGPRGGLIRREPCCPACGENGLERKAA